MNLSDLIRITNVDTLYNKYIELYEQMDKEKFVEIYQYLKSYNVKESIEFTIYIKKVVEEETYFDVYGMKVDDKQSYSLEFELWKDWISYKIDEMTLINFSREEIYSHIFWEMTYHGYEESDIQDVKEELERRVKSIEDGNEKLYTMEEIFGKYLVDDKKDCD